MGKRLLAFALLGGLSLSASAAQAPLRLNYQGKLLDASNNPRSGAVSIEFRILDAASGGSVLWGPETLTPTLTNGVFSVLLGGSSALSPDLFANGPVYLSVTAAPDTYPAGEMTPRQQLAMAPFAITASQVASATSIRVNSGIAYSTFTTHGNWLMPYGVAVTTITASSGTFTTTANPGVTTSSGVLVNGGTLDAEGAGGVFSRYGVIASTINVRSPAATTSITVSSNIVISGPAGMLDVGGQGGLSVDYGVIASSINVRSPAATTSITTSSNVVIGTAGGGMLDVPAANGVNVDYGVRATTFSGFGYQLVGVTPQVSQSSASANTTLTANTETVVISTTVKFAAADRTAMVMGFIEVIRQVNSSPLVVIRLRRQIGGACTTASTLVYAMSMTRVNSNPGSQTFPVIANDQPNTVTAVTYCLTVQDPSADAYRTANLAIISAAP